MYHLKITLAAVNGVKRSWQAIWNLFVFLVRSTVIAFLPHDLPIFILVFVFDLPAFHVALISSYNACKSKVPFCTH